VATVPAYFRATGPTAADGNPTAPAFGHRPTAKPRNHVEDEFRAAAGELVALGRDNCQAAAFYDSPASPTGRRR